MLIMTTNIDPADKTFSAPSPTQQKIADFMAWVADTIDYLSHNLWPIVDLVIRLFIAKQALFSGFLLATDWHMATSMASAANAIPSVGSAAQALPVILVLILGGLSLLLGFGTRVGALAILLLSAWTHHYSMPSDLNLFWMIWMAGCVMRGAGSLSLDHLMASGMKNSAVPFVSGLVRMFRASYPPLSALYLLGLRLWLMFGMVMTVIISAENWDGHTNAMLSWLPLHSAHNLFGEASILIPIFLGFGFLTRVAAFSGIAFIGYSAVMTDMINFPFYWITTLGILLAYGPGPLSLDGAILGILKRKIPQLSGKPAFSLDGLPHVVIVGAGFGGIACARALRHAPVKVTLIDSHNYFLFQPLLYQVATAGLSPGDIAVPIRSIFRDQFNAEVFLGTVKDIDVVNRKLIADRMTIGYDHLVIATGATHSYFGKDVWAPYAPGLKRVDDATSIRRRILEAFELAEVAATNEERKRLLNFVIVGGGPTGVELAGAIAELARFGMEKDFRNFDPSMAHIVLVQAAPRILPTFPETLSALAQKSLEAIGAKVLINSRVEQIDVEGVIVNGERIYSKSVLWAAGVTASPAAKWLKAEADQAGRVKVADDLSVPGLTNIFVIGDTASANCWDGKPVPGLAPAAKQGGEYVAKAIIARLFNKQNAPFVYKHLGSLATIGRKAAVADFGRVKLGGALAWWFWGLVHVFFLVGTRNRLTVIINWLWSYITFRASTRLITGPAAQE
mgnify:CR=1 FL=1